MGGKTQSPPCWGGWTASEPAHPPRDTLSRRAPPVGSQPPSEGIGQALPAEPGNRLPASIKELDLETDGTRCPRHLAQRTLVETEISCVGREKRLSVKQPVTGVPSWESKLGTRETLQGHKTHLPASNREISKYAVFLILVASVRLQALKQEGTGWSQSHGSP